MNNTTTASINLNQITQSIKTECKTNNSINIPYFFSTIDKKNSSNNIISLSKKKGKEQTKNNKLK